MIPIKTEKELLTHCTKKSCGFCKNNYLELKVLCDKNIRYYAFIDDILKILFPLIVKHNRKAKLKKLLS